MPLISQVHLACSKTMSTSRSYSAQSWCSLFGLVDCIMHHKNNSTTYESFARDAEVHITPGDSEMPLGSFCQSLFAALPPPSLPLSMPLSCVSVGFDRRETRKGKHFQMIQLIEECWRERESEADSKLV